MKSVLNKLGLKRLEPYEGKLSRTVLRGWKKWKRFFYYPTLILTAYMLLPIEIFSCCGSYDPEGRHPSKTHLFVFISSSMPRQSLQNYLIEAKKYEAVLIIRGLINGSFVATQKFIQTFGNDAFFQVNDEAFQRFGITQVPAIVLVRDQDCPPGEKCNLIFDKIYGNISIKHALNLFDEQGDVKDAVND